MASARISGVNAACERIHGLSINQDREFWGGAAAPKYPALIYGCEPAILGVALGCEQKTANRVKYQRKVAHIHEK
jgi:hypothetical protein